MEEHDGKRKKTKVDEEEEEVIVENKLRKRNTLFV